MIEGYAKHLIAGSGTSFGSVAGLYIPLPVRLVTPISPYLFMTEGLTKLTLNIDFPKSFKNIIPSIINGLDPGESNIGQNNSKVLFRDIWFELRDPSTVTVSPVPTLY
jgi:hypothetical protein